MILGNLVQVFLIIGGEPMRLGLRLAARIQVAVHEIAGL
jgi:hypothetical protein